ncbi:MAG TPA: hypothetical protein VFD58_08850 [Blastocatellia bacterium]|nr:hypothetical protein [Blastocatellia bacterium]
MNRSGGLTLPVFEVSVQDDTTGDQLLFNLSNGSYFFRRCAGRSSFTLSGEGVT